MKNFVKMCPNNFVGTAATIKENKIDFFKNQKNTKIYNFIAFQKFLISNSDNKLDLLTPQNLYHT